MMVRCGRCARRYDKDIQYHILCDECYDEVGIYGDSDSSKFWRFMAYWANENATPEEMKEAADCAVGQEIIRKLLDSMDVGMKFKLLKSEVSKLQ